MNIPNNIIKQQLNNVYFIIGTNCGGKTTMAKQLAVRHNMIYYSADEHYWEHRKLSNQTHQPHMNRPFLGWQEYFKRDIEDQATWLLSCMEEAMPFIILDLLHLSNTHNQAIIADVHAMPDYLQPITDYNHIYALTADEAVIKRDFFKRDDKKPLLNRIELEMENVEQTVHHQLNTVIHIAKIEQQKIKAHNIQRDRRTTQTNYNARLKRVAMHFNLT